MVESVEEYVDELAERTVQLGGTAEGTATVVAKRSTIGEYPRGADKYLWLVEAHNQSHQRRAQS